VAATPLTGERADGTGRQPEHGGRGERAPRRRDLGRRHPVDPDRLLGTEPRRQAPGRRRDWQTARAALALLGGWDRHRDHRDQRHPDRDRPGRQLAGQERDGR